MTSIAMFNHVEIAYGVRRGSRIHTGSRWNLGAGAKLLADDARYQRLRRGLSRTSNLLFAKQVEWLAEATGLRVFDVELNACNGGSFRLAVPKG